MFELQDDMKVYKLLRSDLKASEVDLVSMIILFIMSSRIRLTYRIGGDSTGVDCS